MRRIACGFPIFYAANVISLSGDLKGFDPQPKRFRKNCYLKQRCAAFSADALAGLSDQSAQFKGRTGCVTADGKASALEDARLWLQWVVLPLRSPPQQRD
jgi:hypothetical protein